MVCAVGVSASDRVGSWKSMVSSLARRVTRSRSRGLDNPAGKAGHGSENGIGSPGRTTALSSSPSNHVGTCERNKVGKEVQTPSKSQHDSSLTKGVHVHESHHRKDSPYIPLLCHRCRLSNDVDEHWQFHGK